MQIAGSVQRIEIKPETDEEKAHLQRLVGWEWARDQRTGPLMFWGDSDTFGGAFVIISPNLAPDYEARLAEAAEAAAGGSEPFPAA
ncbi:MAG: hypothetical protein U0990_05525 [Candidatus Nanopelagicales bacterium]|nr:hypothetical protein [Candidatus Nanopelagicales bacterium]